ncbi:MAG: thioredoxin domain-containing protein [Rhizobacter sp.]|nr:thioredoxin domain-containing protein [Ferruginibacter sp.]
MFYPFEPNVKATIRFLSLLKVKVNNNTVNETLQNHPEWPSLLCVTDSLSKWEIPNGVAKMPLDKIEELPTPFIAHIDDLENPLVIVESVDSKTMSIYHKSYHTRSTIPTNDFLKKWNGIYLIAEPDDHSGEKDYKKIKKRLLLNSMVPIAAVLALLSLFIFFFQQNSGSAVFPKSGIYVQILLFFLGTIVTTALLWYELDKNNPILQKVCTGIIKGNCNHILTSKAAKVFSWLTWSEIGFFYFTGGLLSLIFVQNSFSAVAWLNILALPYILYSLYYQSQIAKQWCTLCLMVQILLLLGGFNVFYHYNPTQLALASPVLMAKTVLLYILPMLVWFTIKPLLLRLQEAQNLKREYLRVKFNLEIFETLLKKQKKISFTYDGIGIEMGNPSAKHTIIKVCNPYCSPCAQAHPKLEELLHQNNNIKVKIIFLVPNNEHHPGIKPVRHLMAIAAEGNELKLKNALDDWYLPEIKDYDKFNKKYPMNGELTMQGSKIEMMDEWCRNVGIIATPTIFINGQQLPEAYSIGDLQYFLLE